jgi:hypothetical protein
MIRLRTSGDQEWVETTPLLSAAAEADTATAAPTGFFAL